MNAPTMFCQHTSMAWNTQSWTKIGNAKERCDFCGEERFTIGIRNAISDEERGMLFGRTDFDPELKNLFNDLRSLGAYIGTATVNDPIDGRIYRATAYIFYQGNEGPVLSVSSSIDDFHALHCLRLVLNTWYGV